jgi:FMN-dependent NADH-azoreductase
MKTLIVKYIPRNEQSNTKKLLDAFRDEISDSHVDELDLIDEAPDILADNNLLAYIKRNFLGLELLPQEEKFLSKIDRMAAQLKSADIVVVVFPMYNFSMPAIVKAWFDSVMQNGVTFGKGYDDQVVISNAGKKALSLISSGGVYSNKSFSNREHALSLSNLEFQYMGYSDVRGILAEGMDMSEEIKQINLNNSIWQVQEIAREWYRKEGYEDLMCIKHNNRKTKLDKTR